MFDINVFWNEHFMITVKISDGGHLEASIPQEKALPTLLNSTPAISEKRRDPNGPRLECFHNGIILIVNCFQKSYLWLLNTTCEPQMPRPEELWIAFKNLIFDYWTQRNVNALVDYDGCELLSKILSLTIEHNDCSEVSLCFDVVNCFQKSYLWLLNTTCACKGWKRLRLWIAFKNLIFDYWTQLSGRGIIFAKRCELLSKILSLTIEHNIDAIVKDMFVVVNCFQKSYLWLLNTTI